MDDIHQINFSRAIFKHLDVDLLLSIPNIFSDNFKLVLVNYKNMTADIFSGHNFFNFGSSSCFIIEVFNQLQGNLTNLCDIFALIDKLVQKYESIISDEEKFVSFLLLLFLFLKENVWGPSFSFIKESEKVEHAKQKDLFDNNYFLLLDQNTSPELKGELINYLTISGEVPYKHSKLLIFFIIAYEYIVKRNTFAKHEVSGLWKIRLLFLHNKMIDEPIESLMEEIFKLLADLKLNDLTEDDKYMKGLIECEMSYIKLKYYKYKENEESVEQAKGNLNSKVELTGKMGRRTKFQDFDSAILVLERNSKDDSAQEVANAQEIETLPNKISLNEENPLLETPKLNNEETFTISIADQIYITALINNFRHSVPDEELLREVILAYTNKCLEKSYDWLVYSKLLLHRSLAEDKKTKTVERAMLQIQSLCDQFNDRQPNPYNREEHFFFINYPFIWNLKKKYAEMFMSFGAVITAFDIFKELGMNEECIKCLYVGNKTQKALDFAEEILKQGDDPGVYCILGEIKNKEEHFLKALEVSKGKYTRAYRCLGKFYLSQNKIPEAILNYEKALEINPIFPNVWFSLGCLYLKQANFLKASNSFNKSLSFDDSDGDTWANLGFCFSQLKKSKEAIKCLEESLKRSRNNWKVCENLMYMSIEGNDLGKLILAIVNLYRMEHSERIKPAVFFNLIKLYLDECGNYETHQNNYYKEKIYSIFDTFGMKDGKNEEIWDIFTIFIETVEIKMKKNKEPELQKLYKDISDIRMKQARCLMIEEIWEKDEKILTKMKEVLTKLDKEISRVDEVEYTREIKLFINQTEAKIEKFYKLKELESKFDNK